MLQNDWDLIIKSKNLQPKDVDTVIYHHPCTDGTASGYVAWKYFQMNFPTKHVDYYPMTIGSQPPPDLQGKNVLICDYSYKKDILNSLLTIVNNLLIIDHHKSAEKDLKDIDEKYKIFHMGHSGAMLTWYYFFTGIEPPVFIQYVQDRDIWTKALPLTDEFTSWFYTLPLEFEEYDKYIDDDLMSEMVQIKGIPYKELNDYYCRESVDHAIPKFCKIKDKYYFVAYVNSTVVKSDIGNLIFEKYPLIDFSAVYSISDSSESTSFSLRSTKKHSDVSEIAFSLGGGGHAEASGVRVQFVTNKLPGEVYGKLYSVLKYVYFGKIDIDDIRYGIVYLPSYMYKREFGSYLLQTKYKVWNKDKQTNEDISVAQSLMNNLNNGVDRQYNVSGSNTLLIDDSCKIEISAVWTYNACTNKTSFILGFSENLKKRKVELDGWFGFDTDMEIEYSGFHQTIPVGGTVGKVMNIYNLW